jgi:hypothetical protein
MVTRLLAVVVVGGLTLAAVTGCVCAKQSGKPVATGKTGLHAKLQPTISSLNPSSVKKDSEEKLSVHGSNFIEKSWIVVDGNFLGTTFVSSSELKTVLTKKETGSTGKKSVKVHDADGNLSNEVKLIVE